MQVSVFFLLSWLGNKSRCICFLANLQLSSMYIDVNVIILCLMKYGLNKSVCLILANIQMHFFFVIQRYPVMIIYVKKSTIFFFQTWFSRYILILLVLKYYMHKKLCEILIMPKIVLCFCNYLEKNYAT